MVGLATEKMENGQKRQTKVAVWDALRIGMTPEKKSIDWQPQMLCLGTGMWSMKIWGLGFWTQILVSGFSFRKQNC